MPTLYDSRLSGNGWKVRLLLSHLKLPYQRHILDIAAGQTKTPAFLQLNSLARIPVLLLDDASTIRESNAILWYLATGSSYLPAAPLAQARVLEWLFFEQYDHLKNMARPRYLVSIAKVSDEFTQELMSLRQGGEKALSTMERQLARTPFLCGADYTIADIALFPYTSMAAMGGYDLNGYPAIKDWVKRVRAQPGFIELLDHRD
ncbi:MAG: yfcG 5 [Herminiimonas sp.]|nr:yfcG 5 [Herminiimonas sp.]